MAGFARHLRDGVHIHCDQQHRRAHRRCGSGGFASGMACAYHDHIIFLKHIITHLLNHFN
jgi:hypothetical protein